MATMIQRKTEIYRERVFETRYEKKRWLIFTWYQQLSSEKKSDNLVIRTLDDIDKIYLYRGKGVGVELIEKGQGNS